VAIVRTFVTADEAGRFVLRLAATVMQRLASASAGRAAIGRALLRAVSRPRRERRAPWTILAEARCPGGRRNVTLTGSDPYALSAELLSAGAVALARDGHGPRGVLSPVQALGIQRLRRELARNRVEIRVYEQARGSAACPP
jgi:short subunit dehydrogenase-like uncharacterized protein